jgi:hypothetical protein
MLEEEAELQARAPCTQQLQQVVPEAQHVVLARVDPVDVVIVLLLQLHGHLINSDYSILTSFLVTRQAQMISPAHSTIYQDCESGSALQSEKLDLDPH